jgi:hypothetical protein
MKDYPWLKHYEAGVSHTLQPYPDITVLDVLADTLKQRPEHPRPSFRVGRYRIGRSKSTAMPSLLRS